jgi:glycosyltransferase involved in cell wall biosynthesis
VRIGISTWTRRLAGGVETYLADLVPALVDRGHHVAILHEVDEPADRAPIVSDSGVLQWCAGGNSGARERALAALRTWGPDVIFAQGLEDPSLETRVAAIAPAVLFAHAYRGTCISGTKSRAALGHSACDRQLGWPCLVRYYPHRCGGLNPLTMARLYKRESMRRDGLNQYAAVVAFSSHIEREYVRHGVDRGRTFRLPCHVPALPVQSPPRARQAAAPSRIVFIGRMEAPKGGDVLLDALPAVERALARPLHVSFVGDGRLRTAWETRAAAFFPAGGSTRVDFTGWLAADARDRLLDHSDLLVVPSLWPEPFGLIGLEAAARGVPAAAFDVGGISEWLRDDVNGYLAPGAASAGSLAGVIVKCLADPAVHARLSRGALQVAASHSMAAHLTALLGVFAGVQVRLQEPA